MARTESKIKLGFYPTPPPVIKAIAPYLKAKNRDATFRVLDPCAGDGKALSLLASEMTARHERERGRYADCTISTWAIEPQAHLARQAMDLVDHLLQCSFFTTTLSSGDAADHGWQLAYVNPPYDEDNETGGNGTRRTRLEVSFLQRVTERLCAEGILVFVIPQPILRRAARHLASYYDNLVCYRFPDAMWRPPNQDQEISMYDQFKQIILIGCRRSESVPPEPDVVKQIAAWSSMGTQLAPIPPEPPPHSTFEVPNAPPIELRYFFKGSFDPDGAARAIGQFSQKTRRPTAGVWASDDYWTARLPNPRKAPLSVGHPLQKFKRGYLAVFAAAGIADRTVLEDAEGRRILVKGRTRKTSHYFQSDDGMEVTEKVTDRFESSLQCMDLDTGDLIVVQTGSDSSVPWGVEYESMTMAEFLKSFGPSLMQQVMQLNAPRYCHHSQVPWARQAFEKVLRKPLGKQVETVLAQVHALVNRWREGDIEEEALLSRIAEIAEMASGKTYIAIVTAFIADLYACGCVDLKTPATKVLDLFPAVVLSPPIMARKWKREIEQTIPNARVVIVERFGPARDQDDEDDEEEHEEPTSQSALSNAADEYRQFDPEFAGLSLGTVGCVDRVVERITDELGTWRKHYDEARAQGRTPPDKPCHVLIVTFSTAKLTPQWLPLYRMRVARSIDRETGLLRLRKDSKGQPFALPCCPHCFRPIKGPRRVQQQLKAHDGYLERILERDKLREERRRLGQQLGLRLNGAQERMQRYLDQLPSYRRLLKEYEDLKLGRAAAYSPEYTACEARLMAYLGHLRETNPRYRTLVARRDRVALALEAHQQAEQANLATLDELQAEASEERLQAEQAQVSVREKARKSVKTLLEKCEKRIEQFLNQHMLENDDYRAIIVALDTGLRALQLECRARIEAYLERLSSSDEEYQRGLRELDRIREEFVRQEHRLALYEEEAPHPLAVYLNEQEMQGTKDHRVQRVCQECGEPLWQYVPKKPKHWAPYSVLDALPKRQTVRSVGGRALTQVIGSRKLQGLALPSRDFSPACVRTTYKRRYPIADYIRKHYKGFFKLLIADEAHEGADGTALDFARQSLANACGRMLALTGTLSNGYASSLFRLFYLMLKLVRQQFQYEDMERWIDLHGKRQMVQKSRYETPPTGTGSDSKRKLKPGMPVYKEIAGFDPAGMGKVARCSTFTELKEVVPNLVGYHEYVHIVKMGPLLGPAYSQFEAESTAALGQMLSAGDNSGLSPWFYAMLYYPNMPWLGWQCRTKYGVVFGEAPALPEDMVYPLERDLIDYVQQQHLKGLSVLVYSENTGTYDVLPRLKKLLETKVRGRGGRKLKVAILRSNSTKKTIDREEWLNRQVEAGVDVLLCNPRLVKVGLDLLHFPRIVYMSFPRSTSDLRQSARRSLRPGQTVDVEVVYMTYLGTMALRLLHHMARKTQVSLMVEGNVSGEGLVKLGAQEEEEEGDVIAQMARQMIEALEHGGAIDQEKEAEELQEMFRQAAELEQQQNQAVGDEDELPQLVMEEIKTVPLSSSSRMIDLEAPDGQSADAPERVLELPTGSANAEQRESETPNEDEMMTIVPISITDDPWADPIVAQATADLWAATRARFGVKLPRPRRRSRK